MEFWKELEKSKIFEGISESDIKALNFCFKSRLKIVQKNEIIVSEGDRNDYCIYILTGKAQSVNYDYYGKSSIIKTYNIGDVFGINEAYSNTDSYISSLVASTKSTVILFNRYHFISTCENRCPRHIKLIKNLTNYIAKTNIDMAQKLHIVSKRTTRDKVLAFLDYYKKLNNSHYFDIPYNRTELANYLAVDRCALSIELSKMKSENLIDFEKNHFKIIEK